VGSFCVELLSEFRTSHSLELPATTRKGIDAFTDSAVRERLGGYARRLGRGGLRGGPVDDRVQPGLPGDDQPRRHDHRRQRGHRQGHRGPPWGAGRDHVLRLLHRAREGQRDLPTGLCRGDGR